MHLYVCMYICVCIYMFVCLCIHTHRFVSIGFIFPLKLSSTSSNLLTQNIYANQLLTPKIHLQLVAGGTHILPVQHPFPHLLMASDFHTGSSSLFPKATALVELSIKAMSSLGQRVDLVLVSVCLYYYKHNILTQIYLFIYSSEDQKSHQVKIKVSSGLFLFLGSSSLPFPASGGCSHSLFPAVYHLSNPASIVSSL